MYWYLDSNNNQMGPVELTDLPYYGVDGNTMVWTEGMDNWTYARNVPEVMAIINNAEATPNSNPSPQNTNPQGFGPQNGGQSGYGPQSGGQSGVGPQSGGQSGFGPQSGGQPGFGPQSGGQSGFGGMGPGMNPYMTESFENRKKGGSGTKTAIIAGISFLAALIISAVILVANDSSKMKTCYYGWLDSSKMVKEDSLYRYELLEKYDKGAVLISSLTYFDKKTNEELIHFTIKGKHDLKFVGTTFFGHIFKGDDSGYELLVEYDISTLHTVYSKPGMKDIDKAKFENDVITTGFYGQKTDKRIIQKNSKKSISFRAEYLDDELFKAAKLETRPEHNHLSQ